MIWENLVYPNIPSLASAQPLSANTHHVQVAYSSKSSLVYAASRDRSIYGWKWPRETETELSDSQQQQPAVELVAEADQTFNGHTLGVSALATSEGEVLWAGHSLLGAVALSGEYHHCCLVSVFMAITTNAYMHDVFLLMHICMSGRPQCSD